MPESIHNNKMDKRDEEILELKQKLIDLMKENNEMKELILFLDDERNYARQFVRQFNSKQSMNWNSLKQKLNYLEQKQFELVKENLSLKQLCVLLDENSNLTGSEHQNQTLPNGRQIDSNRSNSSSNAGLSSSVVCQYILQLENELKSRGVSMQRPRYVHDIIKLNSLRNCETNGHESSTTATINNNPMMTTSEEKSIIYSLSETAIKSIVFNGNGNHRMQ
ncbi:uncharacterized protein LOC124496710 [Dermatophagoides farinae]|uniref:uncharacterized protein LOC124496710 n=1 Tax=Dermatophagoides farinae TaxID=6954 RepID=UPI003F6194A6